MKFPGLVDLQVNGYKGVDFSSPDLTHDAFAKACSLMLDGGATAFLPTIITSPEEMYRRNLPLMANVLQDSVFRDRLLGLHLEGPFISPQDGPRGAHNRKWVLPPDIEYLKKLLDWAQGQVRLITLAAELTGADELTRFCRERQIAVSLGHHLANEDDLARLVRAGAVALTHLGNGISSQLPRHQSPIWGGMANDNLAAMIITDGHHLPPSLIKCIIRAKGPQNCIVVSDAAPLAGMSPGEYHTLGNDVCLEKNGKLHNPQVGHLVGSSSTLAGCVRHLASLNLVTDDQLINMAWQNPLKLIGINPQNLPTGDLQLDL